MQGVYIDTRLFLCHTLKVTLKKTIHAEKMKKQERAKGKGRG